MVMRGFAFKSSTGLSVLVLSLSCILRNQWVFAAPHPEPPAMLYRGDSSNHDIPKESLIDRLKNIVEKNAEKELVDMVDEQTELQELVEAEEKKEKSIKEQEEASEEDTESLPVPAAVSNHAPPAHPMKRNYIHLCHFKICNMGRKRQLL